MDTISRVITHRQFKEGYATGDILVSINESKAGDFVMSSFGDKYNKPAHLFFTWLGILLAVPFPIFLWLYFGWGYALGSFLLGFMVNKAARKSASQFCLYNMIENEDFWDYILLHNGATLKDMNDNVLESAFLNRMGASNHK